MNKKGIMDSVIFTPLAIIVYLVCWIFIFGPFLSQLGHGAVVDNGLIGFDAILWNTMNIWAGLIPLIIFILWKGLGGGGQ